MTLDEALNLISGQRSDGRRDRTALRDLLARLDHPERDFPAIHVAGTNGKGSTCAFLTAIFLEAGRTTGTYLSPYVFDVRERWLLNGEPIPEESFVAAVEALDPPPSPFFPQAELRLGGEGGLISEFELKTAVAFLAFARANVDIAVIEAGIGGLRDATNLIPPPLAAVITNVGLDHTGILGETREEIAAEKAGIFKPKTRFYLTAEPPGAVRDVLARAAQGAGGELLMVAESDLPPNTPLGLPGAYQRVNAALAARTARALGVSEDAILRGLATASLPGRFQVFEENGKTLILDVAHNPDGALALRAALDASFPGRPRVLILGTSRGHDPGPFLDALGGGFVRAVATEPPFRPRPTSEVAELLRARGLPVEEVPAASDAILRAWTTLRPGEVALVTGSFYVVGETPAKLRGWAISPGTLWVPSSLVAHSSLKEGSNLPSSVRGTRKTREVGWSLSDGEMEPRGPKKG